MADDRTFDGHDIDAILRGLADCLEEARATRRDLASRLVDPNPQLKGEIAKLKQERENFERKARQIVASRETRVRELETSIAKLKKELQDQQAPVTATTNPDAVLIEQLREAKREQENRLVAADKEIARLGELSRTLQHTTQNQGETIARLQKQQPVGPTVELEFNERHELKLLPLRFDRRLPTKAARSWRTLAFYNFKGGVGKTTLTYNIGHDLARRHGKKVLLVDVDSQANLSSLCMGDPERQDGLQWNVNRLFRERYHRAPETWARELKRWSTPSRYYAHAVHLIAGRGGGSSVDDFMALWYVRGEDPRDVWIDLLTATEHGYDYVIFDCPPSAGFASQGALLACDGVFVPVSPSNYVRLALGAVRSQLTAIGELRGDTATGEPIAGIVLNRFDGTKRHLAEGATDDLRRYYRDRSVIRHVIPNLTRGMTHDDFPIIRNDSGSTQAESLALESLRAITDVIIERLA